MTEPSVDERPPTAREHPPFRMRERRLRLLPDLTPPTLEELRWASRQRRLRREGLLPSPRPSAALESLSEAELPLQSVDPDAVAGAEVAVPVDVSVATEVEWPQEELTEPAPVESAQAEAATDAEPIVDESAFDIPELDTTELHLAPHTEAEHRAWRPVVLPQPEPEAEPEAGPAPADDAAPPLVSHLLVVREAAPLDPGRIAVLDEVETEATATVTRIVALPEAELHDLVVAEPIVEVDEIEALEDLDAEVELQAEVDGRSAPLYWRLLRLRYTRPNGWLRALFFEGSVALAVVLVLAEAASVWTIVVLPFVVAVVVKANDVLAGNLRRSYRPQRRR